MKTQGFLELVATQKLSKDHHVSLFYFYNWVFKMFQKALFLT